MNWNYYFYVENGTLKWNVKNYRSKPGDVAGTLTKNGYIHVKIKQKRFYAHRIVWEMRNGKIPEEMQIDHINHNRTDNGIENLRLVTRSDNRKNSGKYANNSSGVNGIHWCNERKKWVAQIRVNDKRINLGRFDSFDDAVKARNKANVIYGFHENHGA